MKTFLFLYQSSSSRNTKETFITYLCDFPQLFFLLASFILEPDPYNSLTEPSHLGQLFLHQSIGTGIGAGGGEEIQTIIASSLSNCSLFFLCSVFNSFCWYWFIPVASFKNIQLFLSQNCSNFPSFTSPFSLGRLFPILLKLPRP